MAVSPASHLCTFSGCGALAAAVARVFPDSRVCCYVENEATAALRLAARMEEGRLHPAPVWSDVATFPGRMFRGRADLVTGSFPCQDLSVAGKRGGIHGARSGLFFRLMDLIRGVRPRYVFLENAAGIYVGRSLDEVHGALAALGFAAEWGSLSAGAIGASHGRDRWWCLAWDRGQMADAPSGGRAEQPFIDDARRSLGSTLDCPDGRAIDWCAPAGVSHGGRADAGGSIGLRSRQTLGNTNGCGLGSDISNLPGWRPDSSGSGQEVGDPAGIGSREGWAEPAGQLGRSDVAIADGPLEDAHGERWALPTPGRLPAEQGVTGASPAVGDTNGRELQRYSRPGEPSRPSGSPEGSAQERQRRGPHDRCASPGDDGLPEHPPWPDDPTWADVIARRPDLAPATQSVLRRVADVRAGHDRVDVHLPCECNRGDRIRLIGNAVDTRAAEWALRLLWHRAFGEWP